MASEDVTQAAGLFILCECILFMTAENWLSDSWLLRRCIADVVG